MFNVCPKNPGLAALQTWPPKDWRAYGGYHVERSGETLCHRGETKHHSSLAAKPLKVAAGSHELASGSCCGGSFGGLVGEFHTRKNKKTHVFVLIKINRRVIWLYSLVLLLGKGFDHGINGSRCFSITQTDTYIVHNNVSYIFIHMLGPFLATLQPLVVGESL